MSLPPTGWGDLATRADVVATASELRGEMRSMLPKLYAANVASMIGVAGLVLGAVSIAG